MKRLLYAVLLIAGAAVVPAAPAQAAACSGTSGVTVLVQFPDHTEIGCAPGDPASGYQALDWAGFEVVLATGNGTGAICSINHYPDHACPSMPPQSAYWAYFHPKSDGTWGYSSTGGGGYNPKPGGVEGWRFGDGSAPTTSPPRSASTSTPTPKPSPGPGGGSGGGSGGPSGGQPGGTHPTGGASNPVVGPDEPPASVRTASGATGSATPTPGAAAATAAGPTNGTGPTGTGTGSAAVGSPTSPVAKKDPAGSNHSWIWGLLLIGALGAGAAVLGARRRRG